MKTFSGFTLALGLALSFASMPASARTLDEGRALSKANRTIASETAVKFHTKTHKYHKQTCSWIKRHPRNLILIERTEAIEKNGVPCRVCGG